MWSEINDSEGQNDEHLSSLENRYILTTKHFFFFFVTAKKKKPDILSRYSLKIYYNSVFSKWSLVG